MTRLTSYPSWYGPDAELTYSHASIRTQMDAEPVAAAGTVVVNVELPNPVHGVLMTCGITNATQHEVFMDIEGLDLIAAFAAMSGDTDVTEMAKRMASRPNAAAGRVILGTIQIKRLQALVHASASSGPRKKLLARTTRMRRYSHSRSTLLSSRKTSTY